jgi:methyl-accepting chemotaxis protein
MFKDSLPIRLAIVVSSALTLVLVLSGAFILVSVGDLVNNLVDDDMQHLTLSAKKSLEVYNEELENSAQNLSGLFAQTFPSDFSLDKTQTVTVGVESVPSLLNAGVSIAGNFNEVDGFSKVTGGNATIFVRRGEDFVRVVTSVKKEDGSRAVGSLLDRNSAAYSKISAGADYNGKMVLFGQPFVTHYSPIKDASGNTIGIRYIGISFAKLLDNLKQGFLNLKIGREGYLFVLNAAAGEERGKFAVHPQLEGQKVFSTNLVDTMIQKGSGTEHYQYPGTERNWVAVYQFVPELDWIIAATLPEEQITEPRNWLTKILLMVTVIMIGVVVLVVWLVLRRMLGSPLEGMVTQLELIAQGDYTQDFKTTRTDEVGRLQFAMKQMQMQVRGTVAEITGTSLRIAAAASQLTSISAHVANGSAEQAHAASSMASTIEELTVSIDRLSENAAEAKALSQLSNDTSRQGAGVIRQASAEMEKISGTVRKASTEISQLGELSGQVSSIIQVIQGIAEQTNLLALNAAIEAARAGEQGRGFAVVADEVRNLAARTTASAREITATIDRIQEGTQQSVTTMETSVVQVEFGAQLSAKAGDSISEIQSGTQRVLDVFTEISDMLNEQALASNDVAKNVENIATMTAENTESVREVASAAQGLQLLADELKALVSKFNI